MTGNHYHGWFNGLASFLVCAGMLPVVRHFATRWQLHDAPGSLKIHTIPTPRLGGVAVGCALLLGISIGGTGLFVHALEFYLALLLVWGVGLMDDLLNLSPVTRLWAQFAAGFLIAQTEWRLAITGNPILDTLATCIFVSIFANAFNFFDGSDGLVGGVAAVVALGYIILYTNRAASVGAAVSWSLFGACLGFLLFNFPPAKIFLGDSGSTLLGLVVAFLSLDFYKMHHAIGTHWLLPLVFAGLPLMDFFLAIFRRLKKRVSPFSGDRQHFYDLLLQQGWSAGPVAMGAYFVTGTLILIGWVCNQSNWIFSTLILCATFGYMLVSAVRLGSIR